MASGLPIFFFKSDKSTFTPGAVPMKLHDFPTKLFAHLLHFSKNRFAFPLGLLLSLSAGAEFTETGLVSSQSIAAQSYGTPLFSDRDVYNEYDLTGSPLGLFERESCTVHCDLSYRSFSLENAKSADSFSESVNVPVIPSILVGKRDIIYLLLEYEPAWISQKSNGQTLSMSPLNRFGLTLAAEMPSKLMRFGIVAKGYDGTLTASHSNDSRSALGLTVLSAYLGTQVHPLVRIGIHGGATANYDSLRDKSDLVADRYFYGAIPSFGGDVDVGMNGLPVHSNFNIDIATNNFVYVTKGVAPEKPDGNEDALVGDSLAWQWQSIGQIEHAGFEYRPAASLEYWRNRTQDYAPGDKNYPLQYGPANTDINWTFSSFSLGVGGSSLLQTYGKAWLEYSHQFFWASYGAGVNTPGQSRGYDRIGLGLEGNVNAIPGLNMPKAIEAFLRLGYVNMRENTRFDGYHADEFQQVTPVAPRSEFSGTNGAYSLSFGSDERVSRFSLGAGATFFNKILGIDFSLAFLEIDGDTKQSGMEFGIGAQYELGAGK